MLHSLKKRLSITIKKRSDTQSDENFQDLLKHFNNLKNCVKELQNKINNFNKNFKLYFEDTTTIANYFTSYLTSEVNEYSELSQHFLQNKSDINYTDILEAMNKSIISHMIDLNMLCDQISDRINEDQLLYSEKEYYHHKVLDLNKKRLKN